jgi:hypothetical protein
MAEGQQASESMEQAYSERGRSELRPFPISYASQLANEDSKVQIRATFHHIATLASLMSTDPSGKEQPRLHPVTPSTCTDVRMIAVMEFVVSYFVLARTINR